MKILDPVKSAISRLLGSWAFLVLVALILGGLILTFDLFVTRPDVGVIKISGPIWGQETPEGIIKMLGYARDTEAIKAVVLDIDSPGGELTVTEDVYLNVLRLREKKPVVASIDRMAASGGYYVAIASNFIYAKPNSEIGNIGIIMFLPQYPELPEDIFTTGPFKASGGTVRKYLTQLEMLKESFLRAVVSQRGERLVLSKEELSKGEIYIGIEGLQYGLIDEIGPDSEAIEKAAELARIANYRVVNINKELALPAPSDWALASLDSWNFQAEIVPKFYYLYVEPR